MREKVEFNGVFMDSELVEKLNNYIYQTAKEVAINLAIAGRSMQEIEKATKDTCTALANTFVYLHKPELQEPAPDEKEKIVNTVKEIMQQGLQQNAARLQKCRELRDEVDRLMNG